MAQKFLIVRQQGLNRDLNFEMKFDLNHDLNLDLNLHLKLDWNHDLNHDWNRDLNCAIPNLWYLGYITLNFSVHQKLSLKRHFFSLPYLQEED